MDLVTVKVGGSLAMYPQSLRSLCKKLAQLSKKAQLVLVPGGGEFADTVRAVDKRFLLSNVTSHKMAILGMDQYGLLLADLQPEFTAVAALDEIGKAHEAGKIPIVLPSKLMFSTDPLENSWSVTSDSIALYVAAQLHAAKLVLATDVDGIYTSDPRKNRYANLLTQTSPTELLALTQRTSVDEAFPKLLLQYPMDCYVVNGLFPERLEAILLGQEATCTFVSGKQL